MFSKSLIKAWLVSSDKIPNPSYFSPLAFLISKPLPDMIEMIRTFQNHIDRQT